MIGQLRMNKYILAIIVVFFVFTFVKEPDYAVWGGAMVFIIFLYGMTYSSLQKIDYDDFGKYKGGKRVK